MKNVPYKFRGVSELTGKTIYGVGVKDYGDNRVDIITGGMALEAVKADSVAQLIGYDVDGTEIYEGDVVLCDDGDTNTAVAHANLAYDSNLEELEAGLDIFKKYHVRLVKPKEENE